MPVANVASHHGKVVVELMVATRQPAHMRARDRRCIKLDVRHRNHRVGFTVVQKHRGAARVLLGEIAPKCDLVAGPPPGADEWSGDQHEGAKVEQHVSHAATPQAAAANRERMYGHPSADAKAARYSAAPSPWRSNPP